MVLFPLLMCTLVALSMADFLDGGSKLDVASDASASSSSGTVNNAGVSVSQSEAEARPVELNESNGYRQNYNNRLGDTTYTTSRSTSSGTSYDGIGQVAPSNGIGQVGPSNGIGQVGPYNGIGQVGPYNGIGQVGPYNGIGQGGSYYSGKGGYSCGQPTLLNHIVISSPGAPGWGCTGQNYRYGVGGGSANGQITDNENTYVNTLANTNSKNAQSQGTPSGL